MRVSREMPGSVNARRYVRLGRGEDLTGGRAKASILADTTEAYEAHEQKIEATLPRDIPRGTVALRGGRIITMGDTPGDTTGAPHVIENGVVVVTDNKIVAPTSVNQAVIEADLFAFASARTHLNDEELQWQCEQAIRNYDPCISCSCHFLKLTVDRA